MDSLYEEFECVFDEFPKYHIRILLGDFTASVWREDRKMFLHQQLGMKVYTKSVMIMELE
jgi:hypothetical protein